MNSTISELNNLLKIGQLKAESFNEIEFNGLVQSAQKRLHDAYNLNLSDESKFDLTYNAAHALALAALRIHGYRSTNRYIVFQTLRHTLKMGPVKYGASSLKAMNVEI